MGHLYHGHVSHNQRVIRVGDTAFFVFFISRSFMPFLWLTAPAARLNGGFLARIRQDKRMVHLPDRLDGMVDP